MTIRKIYTRTYSNGSVGQLVSGKGPKGDLLPYTALLEEFRNHADKENLEPTALVSGSDRIVDTLKRAFDKYYEDGESPAEIWIAFVEVPPTTDETANWIHSAKELAEKCELLEPNLFFHEVIFEWAIPEEYVLHKVSLQTLMKRELQECCFLKPSTAKIRSSIARKLQRQDPWEIGVSLGFFARKFGARAPLDWVSYQLFYDCVRAKVLDDDVVRLNYAHGHTKIVDFQFFCDLDDGIDSCLYDWWLSDVDFCSDYEEFKEWQAVTEDSMTEDLIQFWETWHGDRIIEEISAKERLAYDEEKNKLSVDHEKKRAAFEAEAVKMGL